MQTALFISSYLESEEQSVKYQTDPNFRGSTLHYPEPVVKTFRRWTDTLRQVPMSIISLCWDARVCCRCKPTCQGPGSHRKSPRTADQSLSDDGLKRHFQEDGQRGSAFQRRAVDCENTERPSDNGSLKVALAVVRRQLRRDQGGSGWTVWIYTIKKQLVIFRTRRDVAEGCSWWNLGTKAAEWEKSNTGHHWQTLSQCRLSFISHFWIVISSLCFFFSSLCWSQEVEYSLNLIDGGGMQGSCYFAFHTCLMFSFLVAHSVFFYTFWFPCSLYFFGGQKDSYEGLKQALRGTDSRRN